MRKIMYNRTLFCIKNVKPSHFYDVTEKKVFDSHSTEDHFVVSKMLYFLISVLFTQKPKRLVLPYSTLRLFIIFTYHYNAIVIGTGIYPFSL